VSEKVGSGCRGDGLSGPGKGRKGAGGTVWENELCSEGSTGGKRVYACNRRRAKKLIPVKSSFQCYLYGSELLRTTGEMGYSRQLSESMLL
jgi:hypothetical protein